MPSTKYLNANYEKDLIKNEGFTKIIGIDEVGRGSLAGCVMVGGYIFDKFTQQLVGINDSKKLSKIQRDKVFTNLIKDNYIIKKATSVEIDIIGIGKTIERLIDWIVSELNDNYKEQKILFLIDGQFSKDFGINTKKIIKGDSTYYSIAAASIIAKVTRDEIMEEEHLKYPFYDFNKNKGYGTKIHKSRLNFYGPSIIHRRSFLPVKNFFNEKNDYKPKSS